MSLSPHRRNSNDNSPDQFQWLRNFHERIKNALIVTHYRKKLFTIQLSELDSFKEAASEFFNDVVGVILRMNKRGRNITTADDEDKKNNKNRKNSTSSDFLSFTWICKMLFDLASVLIAPKDEVEVLVVKQQEERQEQQKSLFSASSSQVMSSFFFEELRMLISLLSLIKEQQQLNTQHYDSTENEEEDLEKFQLAILESLNAIIVVLCSSESSSTYHADDYENEERDSNNTNKGKVVMEWISDFLRNETDRLAVHDENNNNNDNNNIRIAETKLCTRILQASLIPQSIFHFIVFQQSTRFSAICTHFVEVWSEDCNNYDDKKLKSDDDESTKKLVEVVRSIMDAEFSGGVEDDNRNNHHDDDANNNIHCVSDHQQQQQHHHHRVNSIPLMNELSPIHDHHQNGGSPTRQENRDYQGSPPLHDHHSSPSPAVHQRNNSNSSSSRMVSSPLLEREEFSVGTAAVSVERLIKNAFTEALQSLPHHQQRQDRETSIERAEETSHRENISSSSPFTRIHQKTESLLREIQQQEGRKQQQQRQEAGRDEKYYNYDHQRHQYHNDGEKKESLEEMMRRIVIEQLSEIVGSSSSQNTNKDSRKPTKSESRQNQTLQNLSPSSRGAWQEFNQVVHQQRASSLSTSPTQRRVIVEQTNNNSAETMNQQNYHQTRFGMDDDVLIEEGRQHNRHGVALTQNSNNDYVQSTTNANSHHKSVQEARISLLERQLKDIKEKYEIEKDQWQKHSAEQQRQLKEILSQRSQLHFGLGNLRM